MKNVCPNHQHVKERVSPHNQSLVSAIDTNCVTMQPTFLREDCPNWDPLVVVATQSWVWLRKATHKPTPSNQGLVSPVASTRWHEDQKLGLEMMTLCQQLHVRTKEDIPNPIKGDVTHNPIGYIGEDFNYDKNPSLGDTSTKMGCVVH